MTERISEPAIEPPSANIPTEFSETMEATNTDQVPISGASNAVHEPPEREQAGFPHILVDDDDTDSTIVVASEINSANSSKSSLFEAVVENGRTYHRYNAGKYFLPNDEKEQKRLYLQHHLWLLTLEGQLFLAPIKNPQNILDFGTGTGIWAIDVATQLPEANVLGTDLSPIQPANAPSNCRFEISDAEEPWTFSTKFDYIHARTIFTCFKNPRSVIQSAFDALNPGGYLEFQEIILPFESVDTSLNGTTLEHWTQLELAGSRAMGRDWRCVTHFPRWMREIGFIDIVEKRFVWPSNTWPRDKHLKALGALFHDDLLAGVHGMSMTVLTKGLGMTPEEVELQLVDLKKDIGDRSIHSYVQTTVIYGKKPEH